MKENRHWLLLLVAATALFYWKFLYTTQFSFVEDWEAANQGYAWHQFAASSLQQGILPIWDPYTFSGRNHIGEMQPGVFYPLKLFLYLWPLGDDGILSWRLYQQYYVLAHLLAAVFMFFLALEIGLQKRFAAFVAAICFSFGGLLGNTGGNQLWDSAIWLPLVLLFLLRALRAQAWPRAVVFACFSGLSLAMALLAGGLHLPMMDVMVVVTAAAFFTFSDTGDTPADSSPFSRVARAAPVVLLLGVATFVVAAVQLLPSIEYAPLSVRWGGGGVSSLQKIPYAVLTESYYQYPRSLIAFLFGAAPIETGEYSPYLGTLTLFLAIYGVWQHWGRPWVKYLAGLAVVAYLYSLGGFSFLFGLLYLLVPYLDKAREPARFIYLTQFAMALLAGFGAQALLDPDASRAPALRKLVRILGWMVAILLLAFGLPDLYGKPAINEWHFVSLMFLLGTWGIFFYILQGNRGWKAQFFLATLIIWDLHVFQWLPRNRLHVQQEGNDYLEQLLGAEPLAKFFRAQQGLFRVHIDAQAPRFVNLGNMFGIETTWGQSATTLIVYPTLFSKPKALDFLNVRYIMTPEEKAGSPVFTSGPWKVYENPTYYPRAWVLHEAMVEPSEQETFRRMDAPEFDPRRVALVSEPLEAPLRGPPETAEEVTVRHYQADRIEMEATVSATGLLVLSEMHYPGWAATINEQPAHIYKVNGGLRGVLVSPGRNRIVMRYAPASVRVGAILSALGFAGTFAVAGFVFWRERRKISR